MKPTIERTERELRPPHAGAPAGQAIVDPLTAVGLERADALHNELTTVAGERRLAWADELFVRP